MIEKEKIIQLRAKGFTQKQIGESLGCNESYVWSVLKEEGLTSRKMSMTPIQRLQRRLKTNENTGCWEFQGARVKEGYGQIKFDGVNYRAHRLSYSLFVGEIPDGMHVLHKCDNPPCCNPDHLFLGTDAANTQDKIEKGRCPKGETLPQTKVTSEVKSGMRRLKAQGLSNQKIGDLLGVHGMTVSRHLKA